MTDDGMPGVAEALEEALMETHHLANLSGLDEARLARRRLVEAQSATSVPRTRDRLEQAIEYLELARLERRDTATGFVQARELVSYAEAGLQRERPVPLTGSPLDLVRSESEPEPRRSLQELRAETAVNSYEQLQYDVELEDTFRELQRQVRAGEIEHEPADDGDLGPEAALEIAGLEMDIERSLQRSGDDSAFEFVADDDLEVPADDAGATAGDEATVGESDPANAEAVASAGSESAQGGVDDVAMDEEVADVLEEAADVLDEAEDDPLDEAVDVPDEIEIPDFDVAAPPEDSGTGNREGETDDGDGAGPDEVVEPSGGGSSDEEQTGTGETGDQVARPGER